MSALSLAESLLQSGNVAGARQVLKDSADPGFERDYLLGRCAARLNDVPGAIAAFSSALAQNPRHVESASALGALYVGQRWLDKAEAHYGKILKKVDDDRLRIDLAVVLWHRQQAPRALAELGRVLARSPGHHGARHERAVMLMGLDRLEEAAADFRVLVRDDPARNEAWNMLGLLEFKAARYAAALPLLQEAHRRQPADTSVLFNLALAYAFTGHIAEGEAALQRLREQDPARWNGLRDSTRDSRIPGANDEIDLRPFFLLGAYQERLLGNWSLRQRYEEVFRDFIADPRQSQPLRLAHCTGNIPLSTAERLRMMGNIAAVVGREVTPFAHVPSPAPARLRVGYVLAHLGEHVVARILLQLLAAHDAAGTELYIVSVRQSKKDNESGVPQRYAQIPGVTWVDVTALDDQAAAARLRELGCDVLVDLSLYNDGARPGVFAWRPAPVQVNFLGAPYTSGAPWMDYIVTDPVVSPGIPGWCSEAEAQMPVCYFTYGAAETRPEVPPRAGFGLPEDRFVYSGLNNPYKIDPDDFDCWMRILTATPGSVLMLRDDKEVARNLRAEAEKRGVDPARLLFAPAVSPEGYLQRQGMPDLFLDTRHYGAHTTMADSLWMGVPALSCPGEGFASRVGASLLASCGLPELVMPDAAAYEATAIALFHDRERLHALKQRLLQTRLHAAPFDMPGQARALEKAFRHMRERFAQGLAPASFKVAELPD
jgi:tetratricopeptide (TPR) repeat protein